MGILDRLLRSSTYDPTHPRDPGLVALFGGGTATASGVSVTVENALRVTAVMACVRVLAETVASLPLKTYKLRPDGGKESDRTHTLWALLHDQPNRWQTSFELREMLVAHVALRGNSYCKIESAGGRGRGQLIPLHPDRTMPFFAPDGTRAYAYQPNTGPRQILLQDEVWHIAGMGFDGLMGLDPIAYAREALGLSIATEAFGARFFANDARPGVYLQHPTLLGEKAAKNLRESWEARHRGDGNAHRVAVLEEGMTVKEVGIDPDHAQFLETRKFQTAEIARMFRVPLHMINDLEKATFSNIEQQSLEFVTHTIRPWVVRVEQSIRRDLLTESEKRTHVVEFDVNGLLRGDIKSRYEAFAVARNWGWMSVNDIRRLENQNPIENGEIYLQPLNMTEAGAQPEAPPTPALRSVLDAAIQRIVRKERMAMEKAEASGIKPSQWAAGFYPEHSRFVAQALGINEERARVYCGQRVKHPLENFDQCGVDALNALMENQDDAA